MCVYYVFKNTCDTTFKLLLSNSGLEKSKFIFIHRTQLPRMLREETVEHILLECPIYSLIRYRELFEPDFQNNWPQLICN